MAMLKRETDNYHTGKRISVTMLTGGCKRQGLLSRNVPFYLTPQRAMPLYRGALVHNIAEEIKDEIKKYGWEIELHMELPCSTKSGNWTLTGTLDALDRPRKTLIDVKTLQDYAIKLMVTGKNHSEWSDHIPEQYIKQLNIYRYMLKELDIAEVERLRLQVFAFKDFIFTGNKQIVALQKGFKYTKEEYDIPDVPILPDEVVKQWIDTEGDEWFRIMYKGAYAPVVDKSWSWLCKICQFNGTQHCPNPEEERDGNLENWLLENLDKIEQV
jgi:hypothetical protein